MHTEEILLNSKWDIMQAVAQHPRSASSIAKNTGNSIPNVSQQAKLLEAWGFLKIKREDRSSPGKPRTQYKLKKEFAHLALVTEGHASKRTITLTQFHAALIGTLFTDPLEDHYFILRTILERSMSGIEAMGRVQASSGEIHLFVVANEKHLERVRKEFEKTSYELDGVRKVVITWVHTKEEVLEGIEEDYFSRLLTNVQPITGGEVFKELGGKHDANTGNG